jgi:hypothetical protein
MPIREQYSVSRLMKPEGGTIEKRPAKGYGPMKHDAERGILPQSWKKMQDYH